jgi:protease-4
MDFATPSSGERPVMAQAVLHPQPMVGQAAPRRSALGRVLLALLLMAFFGSLLLNLILMLVAGFSSYESDGRVVEKHYSHERSAPHHIAIIEVEGVILDGEAKFKRLIDHARHEAERGKLKGLVLRVDSPGGSVSGSDYIFHHLTKLRAETQIPIVVSMGGLAASGGYYVSMAVGNTPDTIFAEPSTFTGSIGVIIPHYNFKGLFEKIGVEADSVASHPLKTMGSVSRPMTDDERAIFESLIADGFTQFKDAIKQGRPKFKQDPDALEKLATGQIYSSQQAHDAGLVDKIGFIEDAIDRAIELAALDKERTSVVRYKPETTFIDALTGAQAKQQTSLDLAALLDMTAPRTYYLWTSLPLLARSGN